MSRFIVGVIGAGRARPSDEARARRLGELIALEGWVVLSGGRDAGVMRAVNEGARLAPESLTVGILPTAGSEAGNVSKDLDIAIYTGMGDARNNINVLSSDVVVACGATGPGTVSEIALALKAPRPRPVILLTDDRAAIAFFKKIARARKAPFHAASTPVAAIRIIKRLFPEAVRR